MAHDSISYWPWRHVLSTLLICAATFAIVPQEVSADNGKPSNWWPDNNKNPAVSVQVNVVSRPDGVYVQISAKETIPGSRSSSPPVGGTPAPAPSTPMPVKNQPGDS